MFRVCILFIIIIYYYNYYCYYYYYCYHHLKCSQQSKVLLMDQVGICKYFQLLVTIPFPKLEHLYLVVILSHRVVCYNQGLADMP